VLCDCPSLLPSLLLQAAKGGPLAVAKALKGLKLKDLIPEAPAIANYTTGQ
jgi:hypothetical protein